MCIGTSLLPEKRKLGGEKNRMDERQSSVEEGPAWGGAKVENIREVGLRSRGGGGIPMAKGSCFVLERSGGMRVASQRTFLSFVHWVSR